MYWRQLYKCTSSQDGGTLFQLRNLINRRNVVKIVKNDMNATEDFFKDVGISHIVAAALSFFNMENIKSTPKHPLLTDELLSQSGMEKWAALSMCIKELLEKYVSLSLDCPNHPNFSPETSNDSVYEYAKEVLSKALFIFAFDDAIKEGDGDRVYRLWKYLLLIFREDGRTKYVLEALNLHLQVYGLSPRLAFELMWSRFINSSGGKGKNVPADLHMEHLNRACKTAIAGLGANVSEKSVHRAAKCLRTTLEVCNNFDKVSGIPQPSGKHPEASSKKDIKLMVKELHEKSQVFSEIDGRRHRSFPNSRLNRFESIDKSKLQHWFETHKQKFIECNLTIDEDFMM